MIETALGIVNDELNKNGIPYEFMRWTSENIPDVYWIGEYSETPTDAEDGYREGTLMLTGTGVNAWLELMQHRAKIEDLFPIEGGLRISTPKGALVLFYANSFPVPTEEENLKRMQVDLQIKAWKGIK